MAQHIHKGQVVLKARSNTEDPIYRECIDDRKEKGLGMCAHGRDAGG